MAFKFKSLMFFVVISLVSDGVNSQTHDRVADALRYEFHGDRVYDKQTDLTWKRCSVGQQWREPDQCIGKPSELTFYQAARLPKKGFAWRLPSPFEVSTLSRGALEGRLSMSYGLPGPLADMQALPLMDCYRLMYWTNEVTSSTGAWIADFNNGNVQFLDSTHGLPNRRFAVRLMHTGNYGDGG